MNEPTQAEVHRVLVDARNGLARDGWAQRGMPSVHKEGPSPHCALGWLPSHPDLFHSAADVLRRVIDLGAYGCIAEWNDAPGRTKEEVLAAFDRAIAATAPPPQDWPAPDPEDLSLSAGVPA